LSPAGVTYRNGNEKPHTRGFLIFAELNFLVEKSFFEHNFANDLPVLVGVEKRN